MQDLQKKKTTFEYMMHYGALIGLFWVFQYLFFIGQKYWVHFIYFYQLLNIVSPLLMYIFYLRYKSQTPELNHNIWRCILFVVAICFFGSFFEVAIKYAHYALIDPDFFANMTSVGIGIAEGWMDMMRENEVFKAMTAEQVSLIEKQSLAVVSSKALYLISDVISRVFLGFIFSLLIAFLTRNTPNKQNL